MAVTRRGAAHPIVRMAIACTVATALAACGSSGNPSSADGTGSTAAGDTTITVGTGPFLSNIDLYLSDRKGYFGEVGLKADIKVQAAGNFAIPQLLNGDLQFATVDVPTAVMAVGQHLPIQVVAPNTIGSSGRRGFAGVMVGPNSGITTPAGLLGKTVAVNEINGVAMILIRATLAKDGLDWRQVKFTEVPPPQLLTTLVAGRADAAVLGEAEVTIAEEQNMKYLFSPHESTVPGMTSYVFVTSTAYAKKNPQVVKSFESAVLKGHVDANAHPDEVRTIAKSSTHVPAPALAKATLPTFGEKAVQPAEIDTWISLLEQYGGYDRSKAPSAAAVLGR
jgi:NitT/TauT family transport system substrate-binding protein